MYLSVQLAARRLGVSPHTIRRWTASGFLPCTRTAGGHRRIKQEDIDELTHLIGGRNHLAARLARERELETLVSTAIAVSSQLDLPELLREVARQMTGLLECHFCAISEYDPETRKVRVLADYDDLGNRVPDSMTYTVHQFPMAKRALEDHEPITVNVTDPHADAAEVAIMRRDGDKCLLILPMVYQDRAIGLLEVLDHHRERRFSRQEMRLARALAGQAAVALHNAKVFAQLRESDAHTLTLRTALERVTEAYTELVGQPTVPEVLQHAAAIGAHALGGLSCVASCGSASAGASGVPADTEAEARGHTTQTDTARVVVASAPCGGDRLVLTLTLAGDASEGQAELLSLIAAAAADALRRLSAG
ncbi:MAG TPA: GAF domain-containing protein [Thermoleophilia bacterium]|nr:GAF domain-containing protein [Thermoleophilia bacterium]